MDSRQAIIWTNVGLLLIGPSANKHLSVIGTEIR